MSRISTIAAIASSQPGNPTSTDRNVTSAASQNPQTVDFDTAFASLVLPSLVTCTLDDATSVDLVVTWSPTGYVQNSAGTYVLSGDLTLISGVINTTNIKASISITVNAAITFDYYYATTGNDTTGDGSIGNPWKTLAKARAIHTAVKTHKFGTGTFPETAYGILPVGMSVIGDGKTLTIFTFNASLNYTGTHDTSKYLFQLSSGAPTAGNQTCRDFTIAGNFTGSVGSKVRSSHGGLFLGNRNGVTLQNIKVQNCLMSGIFVSVCTTTRITLCDFLDTAFSSSGFSFGDILLNTCTDTEIDNNSFDEDYGYGLKVSGSTVPTITNLKFHHNNVQVNELSPYNGGARNIAVELHDCRFVNCEFNNNNIYGNLSMVANPAIASNGVNTVNVHHNLFDLATYWNNNGQAMELVCHDAIIHHNYIRGGAHGCIVTWNATDTTPKRNWLIYNNVFNNPQAGGNPSGIIRSSYVGLQDVQLYNNVAYITGNAHVSYIMIENNGNRSPAPTGSNITGRNNVIIDLSTQDSAIGANAIVRLVGGATLVNFLWTHNTVFGMSTTIPSGTQNNNLATNPQLILSGALPDPFFRPLPGSPAIESGINVGLPFSGAAPTRGAYELTDPVASGDVATVENLAEIIVVPTTTWAAVLAMLPTTVEVTLDTFEVVDLQVTWAQGTYDPDVEDTYAIDGTLSLTSGITNTGNVKAMVDVTVSDAVYAIDDSDLTSGWTLQDPEGGVGLSVAFDTDHTNIDGDDGGEQERLVSTSFVDDSDNLEIILDHRVSEFSQTSYGIGVGIQNTVNPDANKGVWLNFSTADTASGGLLRLMGGDATTNNAGYVLRGTSPTQLTLVLNRTYQSRLKREIQGADALWTASTRDTVTDITVSKTWLEVGAGSMAFQSTNKLAIFHLGGLQRVDRIRLEKTGSVAPPSNVIINEFFTGADLATALVNWTEEDAGNFNTYTPLNPGIQIVGASFQRMSKNIAYNTVLGGSVLSWKITTIYQYTGAAGRAIAVGTKNVVNPDQNRGVVGTLSGSGEPGQVSIWSGNGSTSNNDEQTMRAQSLVGSALAMVVDTNYVIQFERAYSGSGDATYTITAWRESVPGTTTSISWVETGAPSQSYYATTKWIIAQISGTNKVSNFKVELV